MKIVDQLYDGISTAKIDELTAEQCASMASVHPDYNDLAGRIWVSNHHKNTDSFKEVMTNLYNYKDKHNQLYPLVSKELIDMVNKYDFDAVMNYSRDYMIDYFGLKTLEKSYLMRINGKVVERPQHMWMRVAIGIHTEYDKIIETYEYMSQKYFTHATPTLFNAGTPHPQLSSCYLLSMEKDSIEGIYNTLKDCALISKWAGGIGLHIHNVRASNSHIRGTNGVSNGIVPMLKVFNNTAKYVDQCVIPETIIYTTDGPMQIQDCITGMTQIFTRNGPEIIQNVLEYPYSGKIIEIQTNQTLKITPKHPVYVLKSESGLENLEILQKDLAIGLKTLEWIEADQIKVGDYIASVIPTYEKDMDLSEEVCYIYGLIMSGICRRPDAVLCNECKCQDQCQPYVYDHDHDPYIYVMQTPENIKRIGEYFDWLDVEYIVKSNIIYWKRTINLPFRNTDYQKIGKRWLFLPISKTKKLLEGLNIDSVESRFLKLRIENHYFQKKGTQYAFQQVHSIRENAYNGIVYDLQLKEDHNYLLETGTVHNGGGKRNGSFAIYLEPWHADIELFLEMRKNHGDEELKARDLFYALWVPDLFMERIKSDGDWSLFCPDECPGLSDVYGEEFKTLYTKYESENKQRKTMKARNLWFQIMDAQMETGTPYLLYKDACNQKSNQKNLGTIKSSNLCTEIIEYSDENETAVCNLASIALPTFIEDGVFNYEKLKKITRIITYNLNRIIDINFYPTEKTRRSNMRHRPIGIGVQGLADVFMILNVAFESNAARQINKDIFETIYYAALEESCELAKTLGPYETFQGSPASQGKLQFDLWNVEPTLDWTSLKSNIQTYGLRNSLLIAPMPTASTSQILGFNECIEPITSNIYSRRTLAGEFIMANKYLMKDLIALNLWDQNKNNIISNNGSVQSLDIPQEIKDKYKTVWEMSMRNLIDMAADRGAFICQSQSLNLWVEDPKYSTLTSMHFYAWQKGLKTGIYYLRRRARHQAQQFTIEPKIEPKCESCSA